MARVARVDLPQRSVLKPLYAKAGFADAFAIDLPSNATGDAERLAAHMLMGQARWVGRLDPKERGGRSRRVIPHVRFVTSRPRYI